MKIKAIKDYPDKEKKRIVKTGEIIDTTQERAEMLIDIGYAENNNGYSPNFKVGVK